MTVQSAGDCGVAPYRPAFATVTDMRLGNSVISDNVNVPNGQDCAEGGTGDDGVSEFPPPALSDAGDTYSIDFTMSGGSREAITCVDRLQRQWGLR